jgi:hypothetical protein
MPDVIPIAAAHFWSKVEVGKVDECWIWKGGRRGPSQAYGAFRKTNAHRYAYQLHRGEIPEGMVVRHMCGNKLCVNPRHLEYGTHQDNYNDRARLGEGTGTGSFGSRNGMAKITEAEAAYIRENPDNLKGSELAARFGLSRPTVSLIRSGKRWARA